MGWKHKGCTFTKIHKESPQMANYYRDSELLRRGIFTTAGSFGNFVNFFHVFACGFLALKSGWILGEFSVVSVSQQTKHENSSNNLEKFWGETPTGGHFLVKKSQFSPVFELKLAKRNPHQRGFSMSPSFFFFLLFAFSALVFLHSFCFLTDEVFGNFIIHRKVRDENSGRSDSSENFRSANLFTLSFPALLRKKTVADPTLGITAACQRTENAQIPESAGESAGKSAGKKGTAGGTAGSSAESSAVSLLFHRKRLLSALLPAVPPAVPFFPALFPALSPALSGIWAFSVLRQAAVIPTLPLRASPGRRRAPSRPRCLRPRLETIFLASVWYHVIFGSQIPGQGPSDREGKGALHPTLKPCPSFPWSFQKYQEKPQKHQGFFSPCEPLKTLENEQKTPPKTKEFRSKKNTKETETPRKRRTGKCACHFGLFNYKFLPFLFLTKG